MVEDAEPWSLPEDAKQVLLERFKNLQEKVVLEVFTAKQHENPYDELTMTFAQALGTLSDKIEVHLNTIGDKKAKDYQVTRSPTILLQPQRYKLRYTGAPFGEEGRSFIEAILLVSHHDKLLSPSSRKTLVSLKEPRAVQVFVTLACPYCPGQVINAFKAAIERPDLVSAECIDGEENLDLAQRYHVSAVPQTVINGKTVSYGFEPEEQFIAELVSLTPQTKAFTEPQTDLGRKVEVDLVIVGAGPAGLTAGIYAARSGLKTVLLEKSIIGGQVAITPIVENWPGFQQIPGKQLMELISAQARHYVPILEGEDVQEIKVGKHIEAITRNARYIGKALILATGSVHRRLRVPGEDEFYGHGVSYCATCDGYLFKGRQVVVVGGGNTALTDALYLKHLGAEVSLVHHLDAFNAEAPLISSVTRENIPVIWNTMVQEITGGKTVTGLKIKNVKDGSERTLQTDAVFVAIGELPNNTLAVELGLTMDSQGYVKIDSHGRTNIPRIYAAGDITGGVRQIVTAVGNGATAAVSAFEDLLHPYWVQQPT
ncbi:MAG TPA: FAD-dependent oxidoreductase [Candidatus Thermoplasmatota archaeon]|nr:FAD-dependent oxidoreductase [Candidatus Thermoplasmatota archaeon]